MKFTLQREVFAPTYTLGILLAGDVHIGYTCEDRDRYLEHGGEKVYGTSAIPRGNYVLELSYSNRFKRVLPILLNVPQFTAIRIHGGNTAEDTLGCILVGLDRTQDGCKRCAEAVEEVIQLVTVSSLREETSWLEVY
jgi:hypothetical protein